MAVAEFLENVDLGALGFGESDKVIRYVSSFRVTTTLTDTPVRQT
jgi:hypothetical protein